MLFKPKSISRYLNPLSLSFFYQHSYHPEPRTRYDEDSTSLRTHKTTCEEHDYFHLYKSKGQHLLTNPRVLDSIIKKAGIREDDTVLEIGPGTGNLTLRLLEAARRVVAVEIDKRMVGVLQKRVLGCGFEEKLSVIQKDALKTEFPRFDLVVANIPYGISSPLIMKLVYGTNKFRSATLLLQKEFATRLLASPGDSEYNRLAVNVKLVADVDFALDVSKRDFLPVPKVDSSVVMIRPKSKIPDVNLDEWRAFTRTCFVKKNKTLGATFKQKRKLVEIFESSGTVGRKDIGGTNMGNSCYSDSDNDDNFEQEKMEDDCPSTSPSQEEMSLFREKVIGVLHSCGFEDKRPSKLSNDELLHLLAQFNKSGVHFHNRARSKHIESKLCNIAHSS